MAGYGDVSAQLADGFTVSEVTDTTIAPGARFMFMALKRGGAPAVLRNVRWAGRQSFDAWQFKLTVGGNVLLVHRPQGVWQFLAGQQGRCPGANGSSAAGPGTPAATAAAGS